MKAESPTLTFEQVESAFHKWAWMFQNSMFEHWELINEAWLNGRVRFLPQSKIKCASNRIKCDMMDYMRKILKTRCRQKREARGEHYPYMSNFSDIYFRDNESKSRPLRFEDTLEVKNNINIEQKDLIDFLTSHPSLTRQEKLIMKLMYIDGYCQRGAGKVCGVCESRVNQVHTNIIERFKAMDYSKVI